MGQLLLSGSRLRAMFLRYVHRCFYVSCCIEVKEQFLRQVGKKCREKTGNLPTILLAILPDAGNVDIYDEFKHFGKIKASLVLSLRICHSYST